MDVAYLDFEKAFDRINIYILLNKLCDFGFTDNFIRFMSSYLFNRQQFVRYNNYMSSAVTPSSGVPQGSNLGPLLFLLFINDVTEVIECEALLFADDIKVFNYITSICDCEFLQKNLDRINIWCQLNQLSLNVEKCNIVQYTRNIEKITFNYSIANCDVLNLDTIKDLGVIFDSKLAFVDHINAMVSKSFQMYGFIYRNSRDFSLELLKLLFFSLVRSRLEYAALIWYPIYNVHIENIEAVQRSFLKFLYFLSNSKYPERNYDYQILLESFNFTSLLTRRNICVLKFLFNLVNNKVDCAVLLSQLNFKIPRLNARNNVTFYIKPFRTNIMRKCPINLMCDLCNNFCIESDLFADTFKIFISKYHNQCLFNM